MEPVVVEAWRSKVKKDEDNKPSRAPCPLARNDRSDRGDRRCDPSCPGMKEKDKLKKTSKKSRTKKNPSLRDIGESASENCCACCQVLTQYFKDVFKLIWCVSGTAKPGYDTRLSELFCEMMGIAANLCQDCCDLIKYLFRCLFVINGK